MPYRWTLLPGDVLKRVYNLIYSPDAYSRRTQTPIAFETPSFFFKNAMGTYTPELNRISVHPKYKEKFETGTDYFKEFPEIVRHESIHALVGDSLKEALKDYPLTDKMIQGLAARGYPYPKNSIARETPAYAIEGEVPGLSREETLDLLNNVILPNLQSTKLKSKYMKFLGGSDATSSR